MPDKGTIRIDRESFDKHNEQRKEAGVTWLEYIDERGGHDNVDAESLSDEQIEEITTEVEQIVQGIVDNLMPAIKEATQAAQRAEQSVEELQR